MEKLLLAIEVPSVGKSFDALVPRFMTVEQLRQLLYQPLAELTNGAYIPSGEEILCSREDRRVLPVNVELEKLGINMGDHLVLF